MIKTNACRRCGGDLALERDQFGSYVSCIQCGAEDKELSRLVSREAQLAQVGLGKPALKTAEYRKLVSVR